MKKLMNEQGSTTSGETTIPGTKLCNKCLIEKPTTEFHKRTYKSGAVKHSHVCKACIKIKSQKRYAEKSEHIKSVNKEWRDNNKEYYHNRFLENRELYLSWIKDWNAANPAAKVRRTKQRRIRAKEAFVKWADQSAINIIYKTAKEKSQADGVLYHVDHIIPLQGSLVSGLHVENNLQIIPATMNLQKGARYATV